MSNFFKRFITPEEKQKRLKKVLEMDFGERLTDEERTILLTEVPSPGHNGKICFTANALLARDALKSKQQKLELLDQVAEIYYSDARMEVIEIINTLKEQINES